ncbi:hypothetical protein HNP12_004829 [Aeromonas hydrophila]|uniref:hypothetical protein n=1 Tax=Aeromonas hydrophila TaxID=644 RepID=UPI0021693D58|nr:hypothetical protein [Aeromonas hydrophila]MCS3794655.1 hypothetical protein [Aeromonas hydrophila]
MTEPDTSAMNEQEQMAYIRSKLSDKWWRMNNLYMIENEQGQLVRFRLHPAQELLFRIMWWLNIILKARQLGFSTAIDIYLLNEAFFNKNLKCGIIAHDLTAAGEIYRTKIEVPFDNLPKWLKACFPIASRRGGANSGYILFRHGSSIQVTTSFRSGTVQRLACLRAREDLRQVPREGQGGAHRYPAGDPPGRGGLHRINSGRRGRRLPFTSCP